MTTLSSVQTVGRPERWTADMVYIGMPGKAARAFGIADADVPGFGKPWACKDDPRGWLPAYREYLYRRLGTDPAFRAAVRALRGKTLLCWCTAKAARRGERVVCHGETLIAAIEWLHTQEV
jgi:hypothetical protein